MTKFLIKRQHGVDRAADGVLLGELSGGGAPVRPVQNRILPHTGGKCLSIASWQNESLQTLRENLSGAAAVSGDHRQAAGQRFKHHGTERFVNGGENKGIGSGIVGTHVFLRTHEVNMHRLAAIGTGLHRDLLETCRFFIFADDDEVRVNRQRTNRRFEAFALETGADKDISQRIFRNFKILSELAEFLSDKNNRETLMAAESAGEVLQRVQTWEPARRSLA